MVLVYLILAPISATKVQPNLDNTKNTRDIHTAPEN